MFSLQNRIVYSSNSNCGTNFDFSGWYSRVNTTVYRKSSHTCNVTWYDSGCYGLLKNILIVTTILMILMILN